MAVGDQRARFVNHRAQLITGQAIAPVINAFNAHQPEQAVRHHVNQPYERVKQL